MHEVDDTLHIAQRERTDMSTHARSGEKAAPKWIAALGALAFGLLYMALPGKFTFGPGWLPLLIEVFLLIPLIVSWQVRHPMSHRISRILAFVLLGLITIALITGV